jgi:hypothetical protein
VSCAAATSAPGLGSPLPTSAPGLGSPRPHLRRVWAHPAHICAGTALAASRCGSTGASFYSYVYVNCVLLLASIAPALIVMPLMILIHRSSSEQMLRSTVRVGKRASDGRRCVSVARVSARGAAWCMQALVRAERFAWWRNRFIFCSLMW